MKNKPFEEGYKCFHEENTHMGNCPYPDESEEFQLWLDGWCKAIDDWKLERKPKAP